MQRCARAADLIYQRLTARLDFVQIGRSKGRVGRPWKNEIRHFQIANRSIVWSGHSIDLFGNAQGGFAHFIIRTNVAHQRRIKLIAEKDQRVIAHLRSIVTARKRARHYDEGIGCADKEAEFFKCADLIAQLGQRRAQFFLAISRGSLKRMFFLNTLKSIFNGGEVRIFRGCFLGPAITRERLEICRHGRAGRHSIRIRSIGIDVHVGLQQEGFAMAFGMAQLQDRLAVVKVVPRKEQIEPA
jgi:hypothetical protein